MYKRDYFVDKSTGTAADVLAAYGLAAVLDEILAQALGREERRRVWIQDAGPYYLISLDPPLQAEWVEHCAYFTGPATYIVRRDESPPPNVQTYVRVRNVDEAWEQWQTYRAISEQLRGSNAVSKELRRQVEDAKLPPDWYLVTLLGTTQMQALKTYNQAVTQWALTREYFTFNLKTILQMTAEPGVDLRAVSRAWWNEVSKTFKGEEKIKCELTAIQLLNPHQGKGQNRPKANALAMENISSFWLWEFVKATGLWLCTAPRVVREAQEGRLPRQRKIYVLAPHRITLATHRKVFDCFSERLWNDTAVKMDCLAALLYTDTLLEYSEAGQYDELDFEAYGPEKVIAGFHVTQYTLLNPQAYTVTNLAFLGLPAWTGEIPRNARDLVRNLREVIREHREVISGVDEGRSDGYNLLLRYRNFLSGRSWEDFFAFAAGYSHYAMRRMAQGQWVALFTTDGLRRLIMATNKPLAAIIENPGFKNVAYAIRHSTIIPQGRKARGQDALYEIRYGLGMELKRKATVRDDFVAALTGFMQSYNQENSQILEKSGRQLRRDLRTTDIEDVIRLVDEYGSEVVANLLVAYGYAREPREEAEPAEQNK
ncbi:hypothetical protein [Ammonifex thiophilus]|uniref:Type I-B CRISPR-associated protein Cas8b1/Cst1 n=1 Tax=Ammonifex thiophilus TaxID=444093 RepID=A0A3D8P5Z1_9THEO|nr:hypothetical protein [Ammonifex thiophilus]RDV83264.1 hypothetical protein DXX99_06015 [Ammonifex thiophilus]